MGRKEWGVSLVLSCILLPLGALIRLAPNKPCKQGFAKLLLLPKPEACAAPTRLPCCWMLRLVLPSPSDKYATNRRQLLNGLAQHHIR